LRCLAKNPAHRPTAAEILSELGHARIAKDEPHPFDVPGNVNRANTLSELGELEKAQRLFQLCIDQQPWHLGARIGLAECLVRQQKIDQAIGVAEDALAIAPWCPEQAKSLGTLLVDLAYYYLARDPEKSLKYSRAALDQNMNDWQALANYAEACRMLAKAYPQRFGHLIGEGTKAVSRGLELNPTDLVLRITYGGLLLLNRDLATLVPLVPRIMNEAGGENIPARALVIETYFATGQLDEAEKWITPMLGIKALEPLGKQYLSQLEKHRSEAH
jgi:tetratricopeptide (TPR) repeat protein